MIGISKQLDYYEKNSDILPNLIEKIKNDPEYLDNMGSNSGGKGRVKRRIEIAFSTFRKKGD